MKHHSKRPPRCATDSPSACASHAGKESYSDYQSPHCAGFAGGLPSFSAIYYARYPPAISGIAAWYYCPTYPLGGSCWWGHCSPGRRSPSQCDCPTRAWSHDRQLDRRGRSRCCAAWIWVPLRGCLLHSSNKINAHSYRQRLLSIALLPISHPPHPSTPIHIRNTLLPPSPWCW